MSEIDALERHGHERVLKKTNGTIRFDLEHDQEVDHWFVEIRGGAVRVSERFIVLLERLFVPLPGTRHPRDVVGGRRGRG